MEDIGKKIVNDNLRLIEDHYSLLTDKERNDLIFYKNMARKEGKLDSKVFNKIQALAESVKVKI